MSLIQALTTAWLAKNMQRGTAVFNNVTFVDVVFLTPFDNVPKIVVTPQIIQAKKYYAVTSKTVTGFRIAFDVAATVGVDWIAMSP